jgi:hypothetical protein
MLQWLRWRGARDDQHLVKGAAPPLDIDPIEELARLVGEAQERDAEDERRFDNLARIDRPRSVKAAIRQHRRGPQP